jgi:predicted ATPase
MRIGRLEIQGFMSLKDVTWEPDSLNVIIGPNGSGKSNLLRLLQFAAASAKGCLAKFVDSMGGFDALLWDGRAEQLSFALLGPNVEEGPERYVLELSAVGKTSFLAVKEQLESSAAVRTGHQEQPFRFLNRTERESWITDDHGETIEISGMVPDQETLLSASGGYLARNRWLSRYCAELQSIRVYHGLDVSQDAPVRLSPLARFERGLEPDGKNLVSVLHTLYSGHRKFKEQVDRAMSAAFGSDYEELVFPPAADHRVQMRVRWRSLARAQSTASLSDGTLRYLFLLAILADPAPPWLIAIDEPETGLHPSMLRMVAEYAVDASRRTQLILTTHSPQFLDAFGDARPDVTVAQLLDGETHLRRVEGETLSHWLSRYSLGELFKLGELEDLE